MRVLVTGAAGFIGSHVLEALAARGEAWGLDNFDSFYPRVFKERNVAEAGLAEQVAEGDVLDPEALEAVFTRVRPEVVVHLAARAGVRPSILQPELYMRHNVEGTTAVYQCCHRHGVTAVVLASSSSVYGSRNTVPFREDEPVMHPQSPYAASKVACELVAGTFARLYGIRTAILRFFTVYGPRQRPDLAIASFTRNILEGRPIPVYGDGSTERDYTFVSDVVDGVLGAVDWVARAPEGRYDVFNLGGSAPVRLSHMIEALERALGRTAVREYRPEQPGDVPRTCADVSKAGSVLGYRPQVSLDEGLRRYVEWVRRYRNELS